MSSLDKLFGVRGVKRRRGFSLYSSVAKRAGSKGGKKAHAKKNKLERCHEWNSETAREAVKKRWAMRDARRKEKTNAA